MAKHPSDAAAQTSPGAKRGAEKDVRPRPAEEDPRDQLIAELREAVRARDDFLAVVAHELRNPLTPILLSVQLIRETEQSDDEVKRKAELERLERLIKHVVPRTTMLLEVVQVSSKQVHFKPAELNLSEVTNGVVNDY